LKSVRQSPIVVLEEAIACLGWRDVHELWSEHRANALQPYELLEQEISLSDMHSTWTSKLHRCDR